MAGDGSTVDPRMMSIHPRIRYNTIGGVNGPLVILENVGRYPQFEQLFCADTTDRRSNSLDSTRLSPSHCPMAQKDLDRCSRHEVCTNIIRRRSWKESGTDMSSCREPRSRSGSALWSIMVQKHILTLQYRSLRAHQELTSKRWASWEEAFNSKSLIRIDQSRVYWPQPQAGSIRRHVGSCL